MARGLGLFGELGCTGDSMRYHSLQQRHQRMRKEWAVADRLGIDAAHTAASQGFPRKRQSSPSPTTERPKYRKPGRKGRYEGQRIKVRFTTWPDLRVDCPTNGSRGRIWRTEAWRLMWLLARMQRWKVHGDTPNQKWNLKLEVRSSHVFVLLNNAGECYVWVSLFCHWMSIHFNKNSRPVASISEYSWLVMWSIVLWLGTRRACTTTTDGFSEGLFKQLDEMKGF